MTIQPLATAERGLLAGALALLVLAVAGPHVAQHADYHAFADRRVLGGVPYAGDVLSNLAFAIAAGIGAWHLAHARLDAVQRALGWLACAGLLLTTAGSSWYHWQPDATGLVVDRLAMVVAFAGLLGMAACRVSARAGVATAACVLVAAPLALAVFVASGNLLPWAAVQGGGLVLLVVLALRPAGSALPARWGWVVAAYAVAKVLEMQDQVIWDLTGHLVSGHSLKHVVAALAVAPVIAAWHCAVEQNAEQRPLQAA